MLSLPHLVILFLVALMVFGPQKLPELARMLGKAMAEFRRISFDVRRVVEDEMRDMERAARDADLRKREAEVTEREKAAQEALGGPKTLGDALAGTIPATPPSGAQIDSRSPHQPESDNPLGSAPENPPDDHSSPS
jgi:TatA/E family protein of Tat protein translocase